MGLRPERIQISPDNSGLDVQVSVLEDLGATRLVHGHLGSQEITLAQDAEMPPPDGRINIAFRQDDVLLFDRSTGQRIRA